MFRRKSSQRFQISNQVPNFLVAESSGAGHFFRAVQIGQDSFKRFRAAGMQPADFSMDADECRSVVAFVVIVG